MTGHGNPQSQKIYNFLINHPSPEFEHDGGATKEVSKDLSQSKLVQSCVKKAVKILWNIFSATVNCQLFMNQAAQFGLKKTVIFSEIYINNLNLQEIIYASQLVAGLINLSY